MRKLVIFRTILTILILLGITVVLYIYTSGYRLKKDTNNKIDFTKTGMVSAKSIPEGATVYLDGNLATATNDTISGVEPGTHNLKIFKKGFVEWKKDIEVYKELVTDITAVLISQSPRLEPLTNTGAKSLNISPSLTKLTYFSKDETEPGVWVIPLSGGGLSLFRTTPTVVLKDTKTTKYSNADTIQWSPDEKQLLVSGTAPSAKNNIYYLVDINTNTAQTTTTPNLILKQWDQTLTQKRTDAIAKLDIPESIKQIALASKTVWSPDEKKFLYTVQNGNSLEYRVYNLEKPIPIGEKVENLVFTTAAKDPQPRITWYADSFHLILVEGDVMKNGRGVISLIRIDGTNKTEVYNNTLYSDLVFSSPGGDKLIILTSFKSGGQTDLYTVSIR